MRKQPGGETTTSPRTSTASSRSGAGSKPSACSIAPRPRKPIVTRSDLTLIAGHGALLAARKLGMEKVPVVRCDHLTEAQAKALVIADNKLAEGSQWDLDALKVELEGRRDLDFDTDLTGFDDDEIDALLDADTEPLPPAQTGEESKSDSPTLRLGDLQLKLTDDEARDFRAAVADYGDREGTTFGFVGWVLRRVGT